ncbi:hypothetical protein PG995_007291 [Apiospora arundinis]
MAPELRRENLVSSDNSLWLRTKRLEAELLQELKMHRAIVELGLGIAPQIFGKNDLVELRGDVITNYANKPVRYVTKPMRLVIIVLRGFLKPISSSLPDPMPTKALVLWRATLLRQCPCSTVK